MKILISNTEGVWFDPIHIELTTEERELTQSVNVADEEAKAAIFAIIKANQENPAATADATEAQAVYEFHKPVLEEINTYEFISVNLCIDGTRKNGIINCRINGDHKQIRF
jgi:hypothetical protein